MSTEGTHLDALAGLTWRLRVTSEKMQRYYETQHQYDCQVATKLNLINDHRKALGYSEFDLLGALDDYLDAIGECAQYGVDFWENRRHREAPEEDPEE